MKLMIFPFLSSHQWGQNHEFLPVSFSTLLSEAAYIALIIHTQPCITQLCVIEQKKIHPFNTVAYNWKSLVFGDAEYILALEEG